MKSPLFSNQTERPASLDLFKFAGSAAVPLPNAMRLGAGAGATAAADSACDAASAPGFRFDPIERTGACRRFVR